MKRPKSKSSITDGKEKRASSGPRLDWIPPHPALGAQVLQNHSNFILTQIPTFVIS